MTNPASAPAHDFAHRLLERETAGVTEALELNAAMQRVAARVSENLRRSLGDDGCDAVLTRAVARARHVQSVTNDMRRSGPAGVQFDVGAGVETHGAAAVRAALEAVFAAIADILSDLIGADMAYRLLDQGNSPQAAGARRAQ